MNAGLQSAVNLAVNADGTVALTEGSPDIGGTRASISMQAAEVLGIPAEDFYPSVVDTDSIGFTFGTGGSRTTFATGYAAVEAAKDVKQQMIERAAMIWDVDADSLQMEKGVISSKTDSELRMTFKELAAETNATGGPSPGAARSTPRASARPSRASSSTCRPTRRRARSPSSARRLRRTRARPSIRATSKARCRAERPRASAGA